MHRTIALSLLLTAACGLSEPERQVVTLVEPCPLEEPQDPLLEQARARATDCAGAEAVEAVDPHLLFFVAAGYGDVFGAEVRSLDFTTERLSTRQARVLVCLVDEYNVTFGAPVSAAMAPFAGEVSGWRFGREGSPVLYIDLPYWTSQREGADPGAESERIDETAHAALVERLRTAFVEGAHASEFGARGSSRTVRVWWD